MLAMHDLIHVVSGYGRDRAGEVQLIAFSLGLFPMRVLRVSLVLAPLSAPLRALPGLARDLWRAWRRGASARISRATRLEELLPLPLDEVRARLGVAPLRQCHPAGVWRETAPGRWMRAAS
jgi:ubiquinone biosynthesis protein COQ4